MSDYEIAMSLAVRHPDIDPDRITRVLGLTPGHVWRKGGDRTDEAGGSLGGTHRATYWLCEIAPRHRFSGERVALESELSRVLQMLSRSSEFLQSLHSDGGAAELHVTLFTRGDFRLDVPPETATLLGRLALTLRVEIKTYPTIPAQLP